MPWSLPLTEFEPYSHQVGGHHTQAGIPASLTDKDGRFYKPLQTGERGEREVAFYQAVSPYTPSNGAHAPPAANDSTMHSLARFVSPYHGVQLVNGQAMLILEDLCAAYRKPCIIDIKIGFRTWYDWADASYVEKCKSKDASTTQSSLGFRICGLKVFQRVMDEYWAADRHWGKLLSAEEVVQALRRYTDNNVLRPQDVFGGANGALAQLQALEEVFRAQTAFNLYSASLLLCYDGMAETAGEANVSVKLIDFAHAFEVDGQRDENFLTGLQSLIRHVQQASQ